MVTQGPTHYTKGHLYEWVAWSRTAKGIPQYQQVIAMGLPGRVGPVTCQPVVAQIKIRRSSSLSPFLPSDISFISVLGEYSININLKGPNY